MNHRRKPSQQTLSRNSRQPARQPPASSSCASEDGNSWTNGEGWGLMDNLSTPITTSNAPIATPPPPQQHTDSNQLYYQPNAAPCLVQIEQDIQADTLCSDVHCSLIRAIDSTYNMPLSEHVLYSSYESYDNIMIEQRRILDEMMSKLSQCSDRSQTTQQYFSGASAPLASTGADGRQRIDFTVIDNLRDKYDSIHEFNEYMFDRIGHNLDDAAGLTSRDAQLVQATLEAANQNRFLPSQQSSRAQPSSSSNPSPSSQTRPKEKDSPFTSLEAQQEYDQQQRLQWSRSHKNSPNSRAKIIPNNQQFSNVLQSVSMQQQQHYPKSQYGGYLGKQHSPNQRFAMLENKNIPRPQDQFKEKIDNSYRPFEPLIKEKPNALVPLRKELHRDKHGNEYYLHPYEYEIQEFQVKPELLTYRVPIEPPDLDSTPIIKVENVQQLDEMCQEIEAQKEFAVDVEHHSYRSFQGITCLLQISTREHDYVIDAIKLRNELYRLNRSFTNPDIVKVFHGADCDILWLQRDFGVYVVNLFDTSRAAKLMKFAYLSLAFLLRHYRSFEPDKSYQLADWRERPLPLPMLQYARADTHFLLYIHDMLRNDLLEKGGTELLKSVFERGKEICLKRYEKPPFSDSSHLGVLRKSRSTFNAKQMFAFKEMYAWRDSISRELDESVGYVLPNNLMIRIAEYLPREPQGITALCNPMPPTVKKYLSDIHSIILKAIDVPLDETSKVVTGNPLSVDPLLRSVDLDSINHKQDIAHSAGLQESSVPNLLDKMYLLNCSNDEMNGHTNGRYVSELNGKNWNLHMNINQAPSPLYNFLDSSWTYKRRENMNMARANVYDTIHKQFVSPYSRYEARNK